MIGRRAKEKTLICLRRASSAATLLLASSAAAQAVEVDMQVDRQTVAVGETFTLEVQATARNGSVDDLILPELPGVSVVSRRVSRPMQIQFGFGGGGGFQRSGSTVVQLGLQAERAGKLVIPPATAVVDGKRYRSRALSLTVTGDATAAPPGAGGAGGANDATAASLPVPAGAVDSQAFLRTVVEPSEPYVGQQLTVTVYLYVRGAIRGSPTVTQEASTDGFWVQDLQPQSGTLQGSVQEVQGVLYRAYPLRRFAAFPLRPGKQRIGALELVLQPGGTLLDLFESETTPLRRRSAAVEVQVKPLPEARDTRGAAVAVGEFRLQAQLDRSQAATGEAVTLTATIEGVGNLQELQLASPVVEGLRFLEPQTKDFAEVRDGRVGGKRVIEWIAVAQRPGTFSIPPLRLRTFAAGRQRYEDLATLPLTLTAVGNATADNATSDSTTPMHSEGNPSTAKADQNELGALRGVARLQRRSPSLIERPWYRWALALPPLLLLLSWLVRSGLRRWRRRPPAPQQAWRNAKRQLRAAEPWAVAGDSRRFYDQLAQALYAALQVRLGERVQGLSQSELRQRLALHGLPDTLSDKLLRELESCDRARYGRSLGNDVAEQDMQATLRRHSALLSELERASVAEASP